MDWGMASLSISNVTFSGNSAESGGGGLYCSNSTGWDMTNITFSSNSSDYEWGCAV